MILCCQKNSTLPFKVISGTRRSKKCCATPLDGRDFWCSFRGYLKRNGCEYIAVGSFISNLKLIGLPDGVAHLFVERRGYSSGRTSELSRYLNKNIDINSYAGLTIFAAGSYARGEASVHSDIDLFFLRNDLREFVDLKNKNLRQIKIMSAVIDVTQGAMEFPPPSNDGQFLVVNSLEGMLKELGGPEDDYTNAFTSRMLLLLESEPITGADAYNDSIEDIIEAYFRDYTDHSHDFKPIFFVNDILRFWKTLCLNYEHRRNKKDDEQKIKQKIKNFKLQYSRLMTCFATVALLSSYKTIEKAELVSICKASPIDRLLMLSFRQPSVVTHVKSALMLYHWFLEKTDLPKDELESYFSERNNVTEAFKNASKFGDEMFKVVEVSASHTATLRYLVV